LRTAARSVSPTLLGLAAAIVAVIVGPTRTAGAQSVGLAPFGGQTFTLPFYVASPPHDTRRVFIVEGTGVIRLIKDGVTQPEPFLNISGRVLDLHEGCGECGMFSIAFAPDYARSGLLYVAYTRDPVDPSVAVKIRLQEFRRSAADPDLVNPASGRIVLEIPRVSGGLHNGGQLQFGPDGFLYLSVGDGADPQSARRLTSLDGKLLRIDPRGARDFSYSIPSGNPFDDGPGGKSDEIYAYGLRNPYRFSFDRATGDLAIADVGEMSWEEVDFASRGTALGADYGWPCFEGSHTAPVVCDPLPANPFLPVLEYQHPPSEPAAISGGYVVRDGALPSLLGRYLFADTYDVFGGELQMARLEEGAASNEQSLGVRAPRVVSFGEDACGHIYVTGIEGNVFRIEPTSGPFPCTPQPMAPQITDTDPDSPADDSHPKVKGTAPSGASVSVYDNRACAGAALATGPGSDFSSPGLAITVADNSHTSLHAIARVAGDTSPCSSTPFTYVDLPSLLAPSCHGTAATVTGTAGKDRLRGTRARDVIVAGAGADHIRARRGSDLVCARGGADRVRGGRGRDRLYGGSGRDHLRGAEGGDLCRGGAGRDERQGCP
jgi:glucose/arabinose dehydrogenase